MDDGILDVLELRERLSDDQIRTLVHDFYARIQAEPVLGPIFASRIAQDAWPAHLDRMERFWSTILRGSRSYLGNPMAAHDPLRALGVDAEHFGRWLRLFREVAAESLPEVIVNSILQRAERMAERLLASMQIAGS